ncbi:glucose-6-phosphate isomerase [Polymorphobacter arshaanensis]|uniref:Glucose-6-phosphate isomerase n=1 Tax=Glacieibacterium arshaanense TaxID=2511025 RepID=A0A4Y9ES37_9SPHN|nr:glucose-6-phosphate isomerase [Polymorphobacter arshaanensis]TFU06436.1 glucose-6-phosphate isomerase [Polymorphobacter arshaanensis]
MTATRTTADLLQAAKAALARHAEGLAATPLTQMFDEHEGRLEALSLNVAGLYADFSKLAVDSPALALLGELAAAAELDDWKARLFAGEIVNPSERRAATHTAERGVGAARDVAAAAVGQTKMRTLVDRVRASDVRHIVHIGIGGSALGPALLLDALGDSGDGPACHVVANIDGVALQRVLAQCDPASTLLVLVSKTFTTLETMTNAASALDWLAAGGIAEPRSRCIAVTAAPARAAAYGIADENILPFAETVGGRYSLWSAVGLPLALRCGWATFAALLDGAAAIDRHFRDTPLADNLPALAGALDVWAATFQNVPTRAVFAYDQRLALLPAYLQQLEMESNGKRVTRDGAPLAGASAAVTWGGTGTDAQHAVFQLLHQGTQPIVTEFVAVIEAGDKLAPTHHRQLLGNCFAQGAALMKGRSFDAALALSGGDPALAAAKSFPGNRPSATLLLDRLDAATLGALLAFYEHRTFTAATMLGINPFDQWGVELGKEMAGQIESGGAFDDSTAALMARAGL